jgi:hypothetical protein
MHGRTDLAVWDLLVRPDANGTCPRQLEVGSSVVAGFWCRAVGWKLTGCFSPLPPQCGDAGSRACAIMSAGRRPETGRVTF